MTGKTLTCNATHKSASIDERHLHEDRASGAHDDRPGLKTCLQYLRTGDVLAVWKPDRLGRSLSHLMTSDERIVRAFRDSINDTMSEMESDMQARVRKGGTDQDRTTGNLTWAELVHLTSRPVDGMPCPQLHAHCFAFDATFDPVESKWKAGQFGKIDPPPRMTPTTMLTLPG